MQLIERNELVEKFMPLANKMAVEKKKSVPNRVQLDDLKSAAYYGLLDAACKFDPTKNCCFANYARRRIMGEIIDLLREGCRNCKRDGVSLDAKLEDGSSLAETLESVHVDNSSEFLDDVSKNLNAIDKSIFDLYYTQSKSLKEIGDIVGVSESRVSQILKKSRETIKNYILAA